MKVLPIIVFTVFLAGCVDDISLKIPKSIENTMVIHGNVVKSYPSTVSVFVGRIGALNDNQTSTPIPIEDVRVMLINADGNNLDIEPADPPGNYFQELGDQDSLFKIDIGDSYKIAVVLPDESRYESTFETILQVPKPDSVSVSAISREELNSLGTLVVRDHLQFSVHTPLAAFNGSSRVRLKWDFSGIYEIRTIPSPGFGEVFICYVPDRLGNGTTQVFNGTEADGDRLDNHLVLEVNNNYKFHHGFQLILRQQTLTKNAYDYWKKVKENTDLEGNFFETPPGKISGNIRNIDDPDEEILGYFFASDEAVIKQVIRPVDANYPASLCARQRYSRAEEPCRNCLVLSGSSFEKPTDWND